MLKISHHNTFYFLRNAHVRYVKSLFDGKTTREFLALRMGNLQGIVFLRTQI